jgi:hypothetical protein
MEMPLEAWVIRRDVTGSASIDIRFSELSHDDLFDRGASRRQFGAFRVVRSLSPGLIEVGVLMSFPVMKKLIVKHDAMDDENDDARNGQCQSHWSCPFLVFPFY